MAAVIFAKIEIVGLTPLLAQVSNMSEDVQKKVSAEIEASCLIIVRNAKRRAPKNVGRLAQLITYVKHGLLDFEIISAANQSAYMEFGTKKLVSIPAGFESLAASFRGVNIGSGGVSAKDQIYTWAKQKGIKKQFWYPIYRKIMTLGITPHPYMIPALSELTNLQTRIKKLIDTYEP